MNLLVTGGAGYIGSHTVRALLDEGHQVVVVDVAPAPKAAALDGARFVLADIAEPDLLARLLDEHQVEGVIHFAAYKSVAESMRAPDRYFRNNVVGSLAVLEAMVRAETPYIVFSSSCSVYGTADHLPVNEDAPIRPESPYAASKVMSEDMLEWFRALCGVQYVSLRYFNAAGASLDGQLGEDGARSTMLIPSLLRAAAGRRDAVDLFGEDYATPDGTAVRDYIHVLDLAAAHTLALRYLAAGGPSRILNVGTGQGYSVKEIVAACEEAVGHPIPVRYTDRRPGDPPAVWADATRAREVLGWQPKYELPAIVESAWRWHQAEA